MMFRLIGGWKLITVCVVFVWVLLGLFISFHRYENNGFHVQTERQHWMGFTNREARLAQRVREGEDQIQWLKLQLANTQNKMAQVGTQIVNLHVHLLCPSLVSN